MLGQRVRERGGGEARRRGSECSLTHSLAHTFPRSPVALLFSGQGSQYAGMGVRLQHHLAGRETFQEANNTLGMDIAQLCCSGTDDDLTDTEIAQPAILTCSIAAFRILNEKANHRGTEARREKDQSNFSVSSCLRGFLRPSATAGLSVGEYSALVASEVLSFADALRLVKERGRLMAEASAANPGMMVAILGLDSAVVESVCEEASKGTHGGGAPTGIVWPANYNCPSQVVISGEKEAVQKAVQLAQKAGARKCITLNVSGAFHSVLMRPAESGLREVLNGIPFSRPKIPFVANVTGDYVEEPEEIRENLALQLSNPIQWEASIRRMIGDGITTFVEVGPGKVLAGLVRKIYREAEISSTDDLLSL